MKDPGPGATPAVDDAAPAPHDLLSRLRRGDLVTPAAQLPTAEQTFLEDCEAYVATLERMSRAALAGERVPLPRLPLVGRWQDAILAVHALATAVQEEPSRRHAPSSDSMRANRERLERSQQELEKSRLLLEKRAEELSLSWKTRTEFLANMSHELRSPLNTLLILSRLLADDPDGRLDAKQLEFAQTIHAAGSDLLALVDDILDLSKIESGRVEVEVSELSLAALTEAIDRGFRHVADSKGLTFRVELGPSAPPSLLTDARRLQQIVRNLLGNAFKFTAQGEVVLRIERATEGWSTAHPELGRADTVLAFSVSDTGIGIPADKQRLIFEPFEQADRSTAYIYGGTGLGLSISRELSQLLGGELTLKSLPGRGSTFTLFLPQTFVGARARSIGRREAIPAARPAAVLVEDGRAPSAGGTTAPEPAGPPLDGLRVLVVDDDARSVFALASLLEQERTEVLAASSGQSALEILRQPDRVDVVLLDLMMPHVDGFEVLRQLRGMAHGVHVPVIALTAATLPEARARSLEAGASAYVMKPVSASDLLEVVSRVVAEARAAGAPART